MSYVERALYDYVKKILTEGLQVLFSKRFIIFTLLLLVSGGLTISIVVLEGQQEVNLELVRNAFLLLGSISFGFIVAGLLAKRFLSTLLRLVILVVVIIVGMSFGLIFTGLRDSFLEIYPILCFFLWTLFMPIASFGFARGLFYNKIIGSALFLGKPIDDHRAIFSGLFALLALIASVISIYMLTRPEFIIFGAGFISLILSILIFIITIGKLFKNDTLNSSFSLFFTISAIPTILLLALSAENATITFLNYGLLSFSLIYTAQGQAKRAFQSSKMTDDEIRIMLAKEKHDENQQDDPYFVNKILRFIGSEGIVLIFLGTFLGYISLQLQVTRDLDPNSTGIINNFFNDYLTGLTAGQVYQGISIVFIFIITLLVVITYIIGPGVRKYFKADLYRFAWLPTYDEAKAYFEKVQSGEIGMKDVSADVIKSVGGAALSSAKSAGASLFNRLLGRGKREEE
ncbi:MAG: hypothetical protein ACW981_01880 [Candidatus Hodarchaeales archaeon]|jgi:hypothetical protein